jgi:hypothetical protein
MCDCLRQTLFPVCRRYRGNSFQLKNHAPDASCDSGHCAKRPLVVTLNKSRRHRSSARPLPSNFADGCPARASSAGFRRVTGPINTHITCKPVSPSALRRADRLHHRRYMRHPGFSTCGLARFRQSSGSVATTREVTVPSGNYRGEALTATLIATADGH